MDEKNVAVLATLLKKPETDVTKALEAEGGLETLVSDFKTNNQVFGLDDFAKLKANLKKETILHLEETEIPDSFKNKAVGWKLESLEKEIKDKYQFTDDFKGLTDLVSKIVTKTGNPSENGEEVSALKQRIVDLEGEYKEKLDGKQQEFDGSIIKSDSNKSLRAVNLDYEDEVLKKQKGLLNAAVESKVTIERVDGKTISRSKETGKILMDLKLDPLPLDEVYLSTAKDYGFQIKSPDTGGHGGNSSKKKAGLQGVSFREYLSNNKVLPNTVESDKLYLDWKSAQ